MNVKKYNLKIVIQVDLHKLLSINPKKTKIVIKMEVL